jgi:cytochrome c553
MTAKRIAKWLGIGLLGLLVLALALVFGLSELAMRRALQPRAETLATPTAAMLADAPRQARVLGCVGCHGIGLRGHLLEDIPNVARVHAPNVPAAAARMSDRQLAQAIRQGIGPDGRALWVMPSAMYANLDDAELAALIAWIRTLPRLPGEEEGMEIRALGRVGIALGAYHNSPHFVATYPNKPPLDVGLAFAPGRRIVMRACTHCHGADVGGQKMEGGAQTPDLSAAAGYDLAQFTTLLRTGRPPDGRDLGLMARVARSDLAYLTDAEIEAVHAYLVARAKRAG